MRTDYADEARWYEDEVKPHESMLRAWLQSRFPSESDVDNVIQDACVRLLQARRSGNEINSPKAFLFATARNLALDSVRRRNIVPIEPLVGDEGFFVLDEREEIGETVSKNQELELLTEAIQGLPDRCRQIFTLRKVYGMSQRAIASQMNISEHTVSAQLVIGVRRCTEFMVAQRRRECR